MSGLQTPDPLPRGGPAAWKGLEVPLGLQEGCVLLECPERSEEQGYKGKNEPVDGGPLDIQVHLPPAPARAP